MNVIYRVFNINSPSFICIVKRGERRRRTRGQGTSRPREEEEEEEEEK